MEVTVLMIDDHPSIIEGYKSILSYNPYGFEVIAHGVHNCESAYKLITETDIPFDVVFLDITLPPYKEKNINSGDDLVPIIRKYLPSAKIVILTSHTESLVLQSIIKQSRPNGLLVKSDILSNDLIQAFYNVFKGSVYYSATVEKFKNDSKTAIKHLDSYSRQIIILLSKGLKTKTIQEELHLSKSTIDKRKVIIKAFLGIEKGNDEDILREARKKGLI
ncbi:response regulator [Flavobacterium sp. XGLA_31]|uniref:response regulator n=1 Tax=Flavobacterium sp. XGLA_31 TaxID=3447666 RepID=UPI003F3CEDBA